MEKILAERASAIRVIPCEDEKDPILRLVGGEGDAAMFLTLQGRLLLARHGLASAIEVAGEPLFIQETRFALRRDDAASLVRINEALKILAKSDERIRSVKTVVQRLRPPILDDLGLAAAFEWQCREIERKAGIKVLCHIQPESIAASDETETALFRILQEGLTNVVRHAAASRITVLLTLVEGVITLEIEDDGRGMRDEEGRKAGSFGLLGIRERVRNLDRTVVMKPGVERGTVIRVILPAEQRA
jgi:signal transduction histidine kinase